MVRVGESAYGPKALVKMAKGSNDWSVRKMAVEKLTDQALLVKISKTDRDTAVREAALAWLRELQVEGKK